MLASDSFSSVARLAQREFQPTFDQRKARAVTVGALDELPRTSRVSSINSRMNAYFQVIKSLQRLTSFSIEELCNIDTDGRPILGDEVVEADDDIGLGTAAAGGAGDTDLAGEPVDEASRAFQEDLRRQQAAADALPFAQG